LQCHHINEESKLLTYRAGWCNSDASGCLFKYRSYYLLSWGFR